MNPEFDIKRLLSADAYPHAVQDLQLLETHISWVILTGPFAYKLKKPVTFDFVDYSTLERRRHFCEEEVTLNHRFSPGLYLGVVPVSLVKGELRVDDESNPVEWAVRMRQFPQDAILSARLEHDELTADAVWRFGQQLAGVHRSLAIATPESRPGLLQLIDRESEENYEFLRSVLPDDWRMRLVRRLHHWSRWEYEYWMSAFEQRLNNGRVRKCHGDMHLKNVLQLNGEVMAFDGIEFNAELQWIDVMSELAFPVMDFAARGRTDLGWHLLNAYLETSGDYDGVRVLRYYLVYRCLVRAKVTWMNPAHHVDQGGAEGSWDKYLKAAEFFAFDLQPSLAITHGFSGSGKSTRALDYIKAIGGIRIRSDVERTRMFEQTRQSADVASKYSPEFSDKVYRKLLDTTAQALESGMPVVVDATFLKRAHREMFMRMADEREVPFLILWCDAPPHELRQRIRSRFGDASEATIEVLNQQLVTHDPLTTAELEYLAPGG